jgi:hypothetical protein
VSKGRENVEGGADASAVYRMVAFVRNEEIWHRLEHVPFFAFVAVSLAAPITRFMESVQVWASYRMDERKPS